MTRVPEDHLTRNVVDEGLRYICIKASSNSINPRQDVRGLGWDETDFCETFLSVWVKSNGQSNKDDSLTFAKSNIKKQKSKLEIVFIKWRDNNYLSSVYLIIINVFLKYELKKKEKKRKWNEKFPKFRLSSDQLSKKLSKIFLNRLGSNNSNERAGQVLDYRLAYRPHGSLRLCLNHSRTVINLISIARVRVMVSLAVELRVWLPSSYGKMVKRERVARFPRLFCACFSLRRNALIRRVSGWRLLKKSCPVYRAYTRWRDKFTHSPFSRYEKKFYLHEL